MIKKQKIVRLTLSDIQDIFSLFCEQFGKESWTIPQLLGSFNSNSTVFYGIYMNNTLVCVASVLISVDDMNLLDIATKNEYKRTGLATLMLEYLISQKKQGQTFSLEVKSSNIPAINLYKKFGFKTVSIRKKYYKDGEDALCMFL